MRQVSKRVLVLWIVSLALAALAGAWFHRILSPSTPEERAREQAERIKDRVRDATH
ncbi:MAG TPA: hypothetical protein VFL83_02555 [Anaeromyxobacter sp.]|nr:hypothetical protein [Anaeromyxobacter sp.]